MKHIQHTNCCGEVKWVCVYSGLLIQKKSPKSSSKDPKIRGCLSVYAHSLLVSWFSVWFFFLSCCTSYVSNRPHPPDILAHWMCVCVRNEMDNHAEMRWWAINWFSKGAWMLSTRLPVRRRSTLNATQKNQPLRRPKPTTRITAGRLTSHESCKTHPMWCECVYDQNPYAWSATQTYSI